MPKVDHQAVLELDEVRAVIVEARRRGPLAFALTAWDYEFGARTDEPGLQMLKDVDMRANRARPAHLKGGSAQVWHPLLPYCREALPLWLDARQHLDLSPGKALYLFPTQTTSGKCYSCHGTGQRSVLKREGKRRFTDGTTVECHHCGSTGTSWGIKRQEVYAVVSGVLRATGLAKGRYHPHVLRHSIITHMLDAGNPPDLVRDRVGHRRLETTLGYVRTTKAALAEMEGRMAALYNPQGNGGPGSAV